MNHLNQTMNRVVQVAEMFILRNWLLLDNAVRRIKLRNMLIFLFIGWYCGHIFTFDISSYLIRNWKITLIVRIGFATSYHILDTFHSMSNTDVRAIRSAQQWYECNMSSKHFYYKSWSIRDLVVNRMVCGLSNGVWLWPL